MGLEAEFIELTSAAEAQVQTGQEVTENWTAHWRFCMKDALAVVFICPLLLNMSDLLY